jgi:hypothetical protein
VSSRVEVLKLIDNVSLSGGGVIVTTTLDLRVGVPRIESVIARGLASVSQPEYKVEWAGGVTTTEIMGTPTGNDDRFQIFDEIDISPPLPAATAVNAFNPDLINTSAGGTHGLGVEEWINAPFPDVLWPFIRFRLTSAGGSPFAFFSLYALLRRRFDG